MEHELNSLERTSSERPNAAMAHHREAPKHHSSHSGKSSSSRKNREGRSRSQEWPDVPDIGKIQVIGAVKPTFSNESKICTDF